MDFLNKAYAQIADLFKSMTPGARITTGLLLLVVVVSVAFLFNGQMAGPSSDLFPGARIPDGQIPAMLAAFGKANLNDAVQKNGSIYVPHGMEAKYMGALADAKALPTGIGRSITEAANNSNPFGSESERTSRLKAAVQDELKSWISSMPGIANAAVMIDSVTNPGLRRERVITASVYVQPAGSLELDEEKASAIRMCVKAAVAGLRYENVTVTDQNGRTFSGDPDHGSSVGDNKLVAMQKTREKILKEKIEKVLSRIPGVTVATTVTLDPSESTRTFEVEQKKALAIQETNSSTSRTSDTGGAGGPAGFGAQQPGANQAVALSRGGAGGSKEEETSEKSESISVPSGRTIETVKDGHTPVFETAAIGIPSGYFKKAWQAANPPAAGEESKEPDAAALTSIKSEIIKQVKTQVAMLLTQPDGNKDRMDLVTVNDFPEIPVALPPEPSLAKNALIWLGDYWSVAGMIGLAGISLLMLRSLVKAAPAMESSTTPKLADVSEDSSETPAGGSGASGASSGSGSRPTTRLRRFSAGPSLRDDISALVKDDPDTAANILRTWIGHAG
jgi:flagellar M-ring protein FliF